MPANHRDTHLRKLAAHAEWEWHCAQVEEFVRKHGHCHLGEHPAGEWLRAQLQMSAAGRLSPERRERLARLDVSLNPGDADWEAMLDRVRGCLISKRVPRKKGREQWLPEPWDGDLADWLREQRARYKEGLLPPDRARKLRVLKLLNLKNHASGPPQPETPGSLRAAEARERRHAAMWEARYAELAAYHHQYGDCDVPKHWPENQPLANWVRFQRKADHLGRMTDDHRARLDALGFPWSLRSLPVDKRWEQRFQQLVEFKNLHGHTLVPKSFDWQLWKWRHVQREFRRKGILNSVRIARLDAIGFDWGDPAWSRTMEPANERQWDAKLRQLAEYRDQHGHVNVPHHGKEHLQLAAWLNTQRRDCRSGRLRPDRQARLEALGFVASPGRPHDDQYWDERHAELAAYHQQHGHTRVTGKEDERLAEWRYLQRANQRKGLLSAGRIARLDALGFEWADPESSALTWQERWDRQWLAMYEQLAEFQREHGHCHVVAKWKDNPRLAEWVRDQRSLKSKGRLGQDRMDKLEALGFLWKPGRHTLAALWEERYSELAAFKERHGHTRVPGSFDKALWHWRHVQREFRKKGKLSAERVARLDAIGFEWEG